MKIRTFLPILLVSLLPLVPATAQQFAHVYVTPQVSPSCLELLREVAANIQETPEIRVGVPLQFSSLLQMNGVSEAGELFARDLFFGLLNPVNAQPPLRRIFEALIKPGPKAPVALCMGAKQCVLNHQFFPPDDAPLAEGLPLSQQTGYTMTFNKNRNFKVEETRDMPAITKAQAIEALKDFEGLSRTDFIIMRPFDITDIQGVSLEVKDDEAVGSVSAEAALTLARYMGSLFRDLSKYSTMNIVSEWIRANLILMANGSDSDGFFAAFVRISPEGKIIINKRFLTLVRYSESVNAWSMTESLVSVHYLKAAKKSDAEIAMIMRQRLQGRVSDALSDVNGILGEATVRNMGIHSGNFLKFGSERLESMEKTIQQAQRFIDQ